eukprot:6563848-Prymnesium_polylepis.1
MCVSEIEAGIPNSRTFAIAPCRELSALCHAWRRCCSCSTRCHALSLSRVSSPPTATASLPSRADEGVGRDEPDQGGQEPRR